MRKKQLTTDNKAVGLNSLMLSRMNDSSGAIPRTNTEIPRRKAPITVCKNRPNLLLEDVLQMSSDPEPASSKPKISWPKSNASGTLLVGDKNLIFTPAGGRLDPGQGKNRVDRLTSSRFTPKPVKAPISNTNRAAFEKEEDNWTVEVISQTSRRKELSKECDCENCDSFIKCELWLKNNAFGGEPSNSNNKIRPFLKSAQYPGLKIEIERKIVGDVILHGVIIPEPMHLLHETFFLRDIQSSLKAMDYTSALKVQAYMWPSVQRGLNAIIIAPPDSGKTLSYLPALCTFFMDASETHPKCAQYKGPLIVILCPTLRKCQKLGKTLHQLLENVTDSPLINIMDEKLSKDKCDFLITTPKILETALRKELFTLKRLCHFVLEDADEILKEANSLGNIFKIMDLVQISRPQNKHIQTIIIGEKWSSDLSVLLEKMYSTPVVCLHDYLEAAFYSKVGFTQKRLQSSHKKYYVQDLLKKQFSVRRCVMFCDDEEISELATYLEMQGAENIAVFSKLSWENIRENQNAWCNLRPGHYRVLLCSDLVFNQLDKIHIASLLVHYSLPKTLVDFKTRLRCFAKNIQSPASTGNMAELTNVVLTDELSNPTLMPDVLDGIARNIVAHLKL